MEMKDGAQWVTRVHAGRLKRRERRTLSAWLGASTENARDYLRAETIWRLSGGLGNDEQVRRELEKFTGLAPALLSGSRNSRARHGRWLAAAGAGLAAVAVMAVWFVLAHRIDWYETAPGEQRIVTLEDGSTVAINTASRVGVDYRGHERLLVVRRGEALFQVMRDARRPFIVRAGKGYVRALGTRFNVMVEKKSVTVSVLEGRVEVGANADTPHLTSLPRGEEGEKRKEEKVVLGAGEATAYEGSGRLVQADPRQASRERIVAWREGKLRFDAWPLERAVREHNRYAVKPIRFGTAELQDVQVSGVFRIGDTDALVDALRQLIDVQTVDRGDALVLTMPPQQ